MCTLEYSPGPTRTAQLYLSYTNKPTDHRGGFPRRGKAVGISHASWVPGNAGWDYYVSGFPSSLSMGNVGQSESPTQPTRTRTPSHDPPLPSEELPSRRSWLSTLVGAFGNLSFLRASLFARDLRICGQHEKRLNFTR